MKYILLCLCLFVLFTSCVKEKSYTCECVYVPMAAWHPSGTANINETHTVKGIVRDDAASDCSIDYEGKYFTQHYDGTCTLSN